MSGALIIAGLVNAALIAFVALRVVRSWERGLSLRLRMFLALSLAAILGALVTGVYAIALDAETLGFSARFSRVLPKGFLVASALLPALAFVASWVGARLARPVEHLSEAAALIAEGGGLGPMRPGRGVETVKLARALTAMRREIADKPYAAAFLRDAWHDLKTPVAAVSATLEVLEDGAIDDPEARRRFLENLRRSTEQLDRMLRDLVTLSRFETSALGDSQSTDLEALGHHAIDAARPLADARNVALVLDVSAQSSGTLRARIDPVAVSRALGNLIENGILALARGTGGVTVCVAIDPTHRDIAVIEVTNEPAAVPVGIRDRLFRRAALADRPRSEGAGVHEPEPHGTGLGLAIARAAIEAHGGSIRFVDLGPPRVMVRIELPR